MLDKSFLQEYGLYRKFQSFATNVGMFSAAPCPSLQLYCPSCRVERTWNEDTGRRAQVANRQHDGRFISPDEQGKFLHRLAVVYLCSGCGQEELCFVLLFGANKDNKAGGINPFVMKIGQYPPWSVDPPKDLKNTLGKHEDLYKRGTICESQGYGIGAFAYYRRIVEDTIDQLLADVADLIEPQEREKYKAALEAVGATIVAEKKIEVVKDMLPSVLRPGGINPLQTLHDALSVGIHALDEDECLALAEGIRQSLAMLCKHIALAKRASAFNLRSLEKLITELPPCSPTAESLRKVVISIKDVCGLIASEENPANREAMIRATQSALLGVAESESGLQRVMDLVGSIIRKRVAIQVQGEPPFSADSPRIIVKTLIIPGDKTKEGILVKGVSALWFKILRMIQDDPESIHQIDCWKWEEIVAGAYNQEGWEIVVLTPKRGDHGRDIIAKRKDWGQLRFLLLDQVKSYAPDHLVGPDEIREMAGVLHREQGATKGLITTTSGFTPGAVEEAQYLFPRLELKPRDKLLPWLASVVVENLRASGMSQSEGPNNV
ncbi:MAG: restriction endonuclease [Thermoguttaceae bacterium]|jgi:hypothetical protein